jgi:hypothetical protein
MGVALWFVKDIMVINMYMQRLIPICVIKTGKKNYWKLMNIDMLNVYVICWGFLQVQFNWHHIHDAQLLVYLVL